MEQRIDRRSLLAGGLTLGGAVILSGSGEARVKLLGPRDNGKADRPQKTLVLLQLTGGNDALSMVVPYADDGYNRARTSIRIDQKDVLKVDSYHGLHPALTGLKAIYDDGRMAIVEGCGYPNPIRSHFKSYEVWHTASEKGRAAGEGWIGKLVDVAWGTNDEPELVVHVGPNAPYSVYSLSHPPVIFQTPATYRWVGADTEDMAAYRKASEDDTKALEEIQNAKHRNAEKESGQDAAIRRLRGVLADANESSTKIRRAATNYQAHGKYPEDDLGESLRIAASLIDARLGSRVVSVELTGFDHHNNQRPQHDDRMRHLDAGLSAFINDLRGRSAGDEVIVLVFSEFGRRVQENGSRGTDHGVAAPMLVLGTQVKGGLYGKHPSLTNLDEGDLIHTTDFRSVYGTAIQRWFGVDHSKVLGARYPEIAFLKA